MAVFGCGPPSLPVLSFLSLFYISHPLSVFCFLFPHHDVELIPLGGVHDSLFITTGDAHDLFL
ncbi:hypothetical protein BDN71DRAFT_1441413 [Pleurotus eryngii]|uniref:Uncharacterized protein n=1 Tax=Pleurotus eryngii TaxID=5323 RepID=A0A9P6A6B5_PLEER|nr:hypothetical protein BDN71DRAFT_1441413 [Pleurotus eryngii]